MFCCNNPALNTSLPRCVDVNRRTTPTNPPSNPGFNSPISTIGNGCPSERNQTIPRNPRIGAVRCCTMSGDRCVTPGKGNPDECNKEATLQQAESKCTELGMRLCTSNELSDGKCCGTGCRFDLELTWQKHNSQPSPIAAQQVASPPDCPVSEANYQVIQGGCYYLESNSYQNFEGAKLACNNRFNGQGKLFEPRDATLNLAVSNKARTAFHGNAYWIGIAKSGNTFNYVTGGDLTISLWNHQQPNSYYQNRCVEVQSTYAGERWNNINCNSPKNFICEKN